MPGGVEQSRHQDTARFLPSPILMLAAAAFIVTGCGGPGASRIVRRDASSQPVMASCAGELFSPEALQRPLNAQDGTDAAAAALRAAKVAPPPAFDAGAQWRELLRTDTKALYGTQLYDQPGGPAVMAFSRFEQHGGRWTWSGSGGCVPRAATTGSNPTEWRLIEPTSPSADTQVLHVQVLEISCASGASPVGRVRPPTVTSTNDSVTITFLIDKQKVAAGTDFNCQSNPWFDETVTLGEPLGSRRFLDGDTYPPHPACSVPSLNTTIAGHCEPTN